jgi:hypothetical protein
MSQPVRMVTCYLCRRKRRGTDPDRDEIFYQVWLHVEAHTAGEAAPLAEPVLDTALNHSSAELLREQLIEDLSEGLADSLEDSVWKTVDDLSGQQFADFIANLPDSMKAVLGDPVESMATSAGVALPVARLGGDVAATLVLRPILEPVEKTVHGLEVIGIVVGLVTGMHPLIIVCAKHLAHDELGSLAAAGFEQFMKAPETHELTKKPSVVGSPADQPTELGEPPIDRAVVNRKPADAEKVIQTDCGRTDRGSNVVGGGIDAVYSETAAKILEETERAMTKSAKTSTTDTEPVTTITTISAVGLLSNAAASGYGFFSARVSRSAAVRVSVMRSQPWSWTTHQELS